VWLIPSHGLVGAAWAMCIMLAAQLPMKAAVIRYALRSGAARPEPREADNGVERMLAPPVASVVGGAD
jgi:hypothetical protein